MGCNILMEGISMDGKTHVSRTMREGTFLETHA